MLKKTMSPSGRMFTNVHSDERVRRLRYGRFRAAKRKQTRGGCIRQLRTRNSRCRKVVSRDCRVDVERCPLRPISDVSRCFRTSRAQLGLARALRWALRVEPRRPLQPRNARAMHRDHTSRPPDCRRKRASA